MRYLLGFAEVHEKVDMEGVGSEGWVHPAILKGCLKVDDNVGGEGEWKEW